MLVWVGSSDKKIKTIGSSETICITDTLIQTIHSPTLVKYKSMPVYLTDTDTVNSVIVERYSEKDSSKVYADIPVNEYKDSAYFARTIGWLDSLVIYNKNIPEIPKTKLSISLPSLHVNTQFGTDLFAPGAMLQYKKMQLGYNYNLSNSRGNITVGWKIF